MGYAACLNPRSFHGKADRRSAVVARLRRFCEYFGTRAEYKAYLDKAGAGEAERAYLETLLPERLKVAA